MQGIDFTEIKKWLEKGDISRLAKEHGISATQAGNVLAGRSKNFAFLEKVMRVALERKQRIHAGMELMRSLGFEQKERGRSPKT